MKLKGSKTEQNLKDAFAGESQANRRYLYFAAKADVEGFNDVAAVFRSTAEGETGHAHGHLEYLEAVGDPATGLPIGETGNNLKAAIAGETRNLAPRHVTRETKVENDRIDRLGGHDRYRGLARIDRRDNVVPADFQRVLVVESGQRIILDDQQALDAGRTVAEEHDDSFQ